MKERVLIFAIAILVMAELVVVTFCETAQVLNAQVLPSPQSPAPAPPQGHFDNGCASPQCFCECKGVPAAQATVCICAKCKCACPHVATHQDVEKAIKAAIEAHEKKYEHGRRRHTMNLPGGMTPEDEKSWSMGSF